MVKFLVCPDSFKGSLTAAEATEAIAAGLRDAGAADPDILCCPMADGGEGSLGIVAAHWGVSTLSSETVDPLGRPRTAAWAYHPEDRRAVIELAEASGLPLVRDVPLRVLEANTYGTGVLIAEALTLGATSITLCLGGSATVDGGIGAAYALGVRFLDAQGALLAPVPQNLSAIVDIDISGVLPEAFAADWSLLVDVTNPLTGPQGAAAVFGPQKGADAADIALLDAGLASLASVLRSRTGRDVSQQPGSGAAGGIALVLHALFGAEIVSGSQHLGRLLGLPDLLEQADFVFTGEGRLDGQSGGGKVVSYVANLASAANSPRPVVCLAGQVLCAPDEVRNLGLTSAFSIANGSQTMEELMSNAAENLRRVSANAAFTLLALRSA